MALLQSPRMFWDRRRCRISGLLYPGTFIFASASMIRSHLAELEEFLMSRVTTKQYSFSPFFHLLPPIMFLAIDKCFSEYSSILPWMIRSKIFFCGIQHAEWTVGKWFVQWFLTLRKENQPLLFLLSGENTVCCISRKKSQVLPRWPI